MSLDDSRQHLPPEKFHRDHSEHQDAPIDSTGKAKPSCDRVVELLGAERSLTMTTVYYHFALLQVLTVASKLNKTKGLGS